MAKAGQASRTAEDGNPMSLEAKPESGEPGEEEIFVMHVVEVGEIEEERSSYGDVPVEPIFDAKPDGNKKAVIMEIRPPAAVKLRVDEPDASLQVGLESGHIGKIERVLCLNGGRDLEKIVGEPHLEKGTKRKILSQKVLAAQAHRKSGGIRCRGLKTDIDAERQPSRSALHPLLLGRP